MHAKSFKVWTLLAFLILAWETPGSGDVADPVLQQLQESINQAVARVRPSVVSVHTKKKEPTEGGQAGGFIWYESVGSGFVVDPRGFVLTNYHVVERAEYITVSLWWAHNNEFQARVLDADKSLDLALLKIDSNEPFVVPEMDNSDKLETGDWVLSVGSPFGFKHSVTMGIVSDLNRQINIGGVLYKNMIQTDAVINQGNSGGPLVDIYGRVVGVGTAIYAPNGTYAGVGFAIPINRARHFFTRVTGAMQVARTTPSVQNKEPVNLNKKMPNDAVHKKFSDCTTCHTISQKSVVSLKTTMSHPAVGACDTCHIMVKDKVPKGPITVAAVSQMLNGNIRAIPYFELFKIVIFKVALLTLVASIIFAMMGVGGGFLYVPILLFCDIDFYTASTTSLFMLTTAQLSALYTFFKSGMVDLKMALALGIPTMIGAFAGGVLANHFNISLLYIMFACVLFLASYFMLQDKARLEGHARSFRISSMVLAHEFGGYTYSIDLMVAVPLTFAVGYVGGMLGLAGGWLKVPIMVVLFNVPMKIAVATSSLMVMFTGFSGFLGHSVAGNFDPRLAMSLSVITMIGAQIGSRLSIKIDSGLLRFIFAFILSIAGLWMILRLV